jgi:hypothetical protein
MHAMTKRRSTTRIIMSAILTSACMVSGCNKLDREDRSKITITGNTTENADLNKTYEVNEGYYAEFNTGCTGSFRGITVQFFLEPEALLEITLISNSDEVPVPEGTYSVVSEECTKGISAVFTTSGLKAAVYFLEVSSGTMKVKDDNGTSDINFDFIVSAASGGGKMTGNFTGTMGHAAIK